MWTILAEQPLLLSIMIGILTAALGYGWLQTGDRRLAFATLGSLLLIPAVISLAATLETDREKILATIHATAEAVEHNDHQAAVQVIADSATRGKALAELPKYEFQRIRVRNIRIEMVRGSVPPEATVDLDASVTASQTRGTLKNIRVPRRVILTFQKQPDDSWQVTDYTHMPLTGQPDSFTPNRRIESRPI